MTSIKFYVTENTVSFPISEMSEPERFAIGLCVEELAPKPRGEYWFEVDTCPFDNEEDDYGLLRCYQQNPSPKTMNPSECKIPHPLPKELLAAVEGKSFSVEPKQYGVNPWDKKVEIRFESLPAKGIKVSDLIRAALQTQTQTQTQPVQ